MNDGLLTRIDRLLTALKSHVDSAEAKQRPDELVFQSLLESAGDPREDQPPPKPEGVHTKEEQPTYSKMMAALVDQVKKTVDELRPKQDDRMKHFVTEVGAHKDKVLDLQQQLLKRLAELEKLEGSKITSESIHTGFDSSHVSKEEAAKPASTKKKQKTKEATSELLNPSSKEGQADENPELDSGSEADVEDDNQPVADPNLSSPIPERTIHATKLGLAFADLPANDYPAYLRFIAQTPEVLQERETDGLLMRAFDLQYAGRAKESKQSVHQALLLQYCRSLGRDGVALFFKRITTQDHQARKVFYDDVNDTYARLRTRASEMGKEAEAEAESGDVEQIQLHAVNPGQKINIVIPPAAEECTNDEEKASREVFASFPPNLQKALQTGELDEVNKVLGKMSVSEAEEVVGKLSEGGMLSMEEGVMDATTEEGKARLEEYERSWREGQGDGVDESGGDEAAMAAGSVEPGGTEKLAVDEVD